MIPFASAACLIETAGKPYTESSLRDLSGIGFVLRLPDDASPALTDGTAVLRLRFHHFEGDTECVLLPEQYAISPEEAETDARLWRVETEDPLFRQQARLFQERLRQYTALKTAGDDARLSEVLTGYPAAQEAVFSDSPAAQRSLWFAGLTPDEQWEEAFRAFPQFAAVLSGPGLWENYLSRPIGRFSSCYFAERGLGSHPMAKRPFNCIQIGSGFCQQLFPGPALLQQLLDKAADEGAEAALVFSAVPQHRMADTLRLLEQVAARSAVREIVINDWGLLQELRRLALPFSITLGVLLQKRRKDVRMPLMQGFAGKAPLLAENAFSAPFFQEFLREMGVSRLSVEACGYPAAVSGFPLTVHLPFYQMNTSGHCTLHAAVQNGSRGRQSPVEHCPHYCEQAAFLYPDFLQLAARGGSLFGLDRQSLEDSALLMHFFSQGADRIAADLL